MKKLFSLVLCALCFFAFTAFKWGGEDPDQKTVDTNKASTPAPEENRAKALSAAAQVLGSGTPEEQQARMESLKRLSQALAAAKNPPPAEQQ